MFSKKEGIPANNLPRKSVRLLAPIVFLFFTCLLVIEPSLHASERTVFAADLQTVFDEEIGGAVEEKFEFFGLASYYNNIDFYIVEQNSKQRVDSDEVYTLTAGQNLSAVGRFDILVISAENLIVSVQGKSLSFDTSNINQSDPIPLTIVKKSEITAGSDLHTLKHAHLWSVFAWIAEGVDSLLALLNTHVTKNPGWLVILLAVIVKALLLPLSLYTAYEQRQSNYIKNQLAPKLLEIRSKYKGEEAHFKVMEAHKSLGVTPFYTLKSTLVLFANIPILIGVFNSLGVNSLFQNASFLWIDNLAEPDSLISFQDSLPMFGNSINMLPIIMTIVALLAIYLVEDNKPEAGQSRFGRIKLLLISFAFFVLFYPFPAVMVLYWTLVNFFQLILQKYFIGNWVTKRSTV